MKYGRYLMAESPKFPRLVIYCVHSYRQITSEVTLISSDHNYSNTSVIVDLATRQIAPSQNVF